MNAKVKSVLAVAALMGLAFAVGGWQNPKKEAGDEDAIKARGDVFTAAWNKDDAAGMAALWSTEGDLINPWGRVAKGRAAVETLFKDEHAGMMKGSHYEQKIAGVRILGGGGVAVVDWDLVITNAKAPDGSIQPPMPHHLLLVMQKDKSGTWMIESARPYVFSPAPDAKGKGRESGKPEPK